MGRSFESCVIAGLSGLLACSSSSSGNGPAAGGDAGPAAAAELQRVVVEGTLADASSAPATHDAIFGGFKSQAAQLGNIGHTAFLGHPSTTAFLAVDTWNDPKGVETFLHDPNVASADAKLFAGPPRLTVTTERGWYGWGTFSRTLPSGGPAIVAVLRGTLKADPATSQTMHDTGAKAAQPAAAGLGDVAHLVLQDAQDPQTFLILDEWTNADGPPKFYGSPDAQAGFAALLVAPPTITLYDETSWLQW